MRTTPFATPELERLVRLCLVFSHCRSHLRLLDAILRVDTDAVAEHMQVISPGGAGDDYIYPMIMQLVIDHGHKAVLEQLESSGNTAATLYHSPPITRVGNGPKVVDVEDMCAWRLSTKRCIDLVEHGMLKLKRDSFERFILLSDPSGFDQLMGVAFGEPTQRSLIGEPQARITSKPWTPALADTSMVGAWMAAWHIDQEFENLLPRLHPLIQAQGGEMRRRWIACVDAMLDLHHPAPTPAGRLNDLLSHPDRIKIGLDMDDRSRVQMMAGILSLAMEKADTRPSKLPESAISIPGQVHRYNWMHALLLCGFKQEHFPCDPLSHLLHDAGTALTACGNGARFSDGFIHLYSRVVGDLAIEQPHRLLDLPPPFYADPSNGMYAMAGNSINTSIGCMDKAQASALGQGLIMHAVTFQAPNPRIPAPRM